MLPVRLRSTPTAGISAPLGDDGGLAPNSQILNAPVLNPLPGVLAVKTPTIRAAPLRAWVASKSSRRGWISLSGLTLVLGMGLGTSAGGGGIPPSELLDPATGEINGRSAVAVMPAKARNGRLEALSPWGFKAHLTGYDDPSMELVFPCGIWFQPPRGRYRAWIEGDWQISRYSSVIIYASRPFQGHGLLAPVPVGEAGRVALSPDIVKSPRLTLRVLHAGSYLEGNFPRWELSRREATHRLGEGLLMPVGPAIGALWDEQSQSYTAISRPFEVKTRKTVTIPLEKPSRVTHLVVQLQRPALASTAADLPVKLLLMRQGHQLVPDLTVSAADRIYALWYGLAPGPAELRAEASQSAFRSQRLSLSAGKIERLVGTLSPWPGLDSVVKR